MDRIIRREMAKCLTCQKTKWPNQHIEGPQQSLLSDDVGELVAVDLYRPLPQARAGKTHIFVVKDILSKHVKLSLLKKAIAKACVNCILKKFVPIITPNSFK